MFRIFTASSGSLEKINIQMILLILSKKLKRVNMEKYRLKIKGLPEARKEIDRLRSKNKKIVFTNGCFDILHIGHARYLYAARELGDCLIVAANSDRSVKAIKGPDRPVMNQTERTEMLAALECVDMVIIFDEDNPLEVIRYLMPDILVKGGDWKEGDIIGADVVKASGGQVRRIPFIKGFSTSDIIKKMVSIFFFVLSIIVPTVL
jgi:D-beta-D-heptose 7-phosphate kinase/D-beta-D-heptose 1-phosphate adenosyltransferase